MTQEAVTPLHRPGPPRAAWFPAGAEDPAGPALRLICFAHAGGTPSLFRDWPARLAGVATVVPALLPGRGVRLRETPYNSMPALVTAVADAIEERALTHDDYAFFGHSMGALLAYETGCELRRRGLGEPAHLFVSASRAPQLYGERQDHLLDDAELRNQLRSLGGFGSTGARTEGGAAEAVADGYWRRRLPALRADLAACETYRAPRRVPLSCPVTAVSAEADPIATESQVAAWEGTTSGPFTRIHLPGGHFYLTGRGRTALLRELRTRLTGTARPDSAPAPAPTAQRNASWT